MTIVVTRPGFVIALPNGRVLAHGISPVVSPDGRRIAFAPPSDDFTSDPTRVELVTADGASPRILLSNAALRDAMGPPTLTWSPDGRMLAIGTSSGLFLLDADTGHLRRLVALSPDNGGDVEQISFSPSGRYLLYDLYYDVLGQGELDVVDAVGGAAYSLATQADQAVWGRPGIALSTSDGTRCTYGYDPEHDTSCEPDQIAISDSRGRVTARLHAPPATAIAWLPRGRLLVQAYPATAPSSEGAFTTQTGVLNPNDGTITAVGPTGCQVLAASPDGTAALALSAQGDALYVPLDGSPTQIIARDTNGAYWNQ